MLFLSAAEFRKTVTEVTRTRNFEYYIICAADITISCQNSTSQGPRTPPTSVSMSTLHPTRILHPVTLYMNISAGVHESGLGTSKLLPKANEVLYITPNEPRHDKTNKMSVRPAKTHIRLV